MDSADMDMQLIKRISSYFSHQKELTTVVPQGLI